jgi:nucleoside-diphosphate-sugar epimerase
MLAESMPWRQAGEKLPDMLRKALGAVPVLKPVLPDPGVPVQLVHHDDVAQAIALAATGAGEPGAYNLAADGTVSLSDIARALDAIPVPVPHASAVALSSALALLPRIPSAAEWLHTMRTSVVMDTTRAKRDLGWEPQYDARETLRSMAAAV